MLSASAVQFSVQKKMPKRTAGDAMLPNSDQMERLMADSYGSCFVNAQSASADPSASVGDSATAVESAHATESAPAIEPTPGNESTPATGEPGRFSFKAVHTFQFQLVTDRHREHEPTLLVREQWGNQARWLGLQAFFYSVSQDHAMARQQAEYWRWYYENANDGQLIADLTADSGHGNRSFEDMEDVKS